MTSNKLTINKNIYTICKLLTLNKAKIDRIYSVFEVVF